MSEITRNGQGFVGFEYKDITVKRNLASLYADSYQNFGWILEDTVTPIGGVNSVTMKFKRDRKLAGKAELTRLSRQFDAITKEIDALEFSKITGGATVAYIVGLVGTAFMAGSVFAITLANPINIPLCIILAIPGFIGWALPYLLFRKISGKRAEQVTPLIEKKYDEIYEACEKGNRILSN
jgi:hypothetical protein